MALSICISLNCYLLREPSKQLNLFNKSKLGLCMETEHTGDKAEQTLREIIHYATMIDKLIASKLEKKTSESGK